MQDVFPQAPCQSTGKGLQKEKYLFQYEWILKDTSLGMEDITVYKPYGKENQEIQFYSILSTKKGRDGRIVYFNTKTILNRLKEQLDRGTNIRAIGLLQGLIGILDDSDGCAMQYQCATAPYMLNKLAYEEIIIYDRGIYMQRDMERRTVMDLVVEIRIPPRFWKKYARPMQYTNR